MTGTVAAFDDRGYGTVTADDGTAYFFHCTALVEGTRSIAPATRVAFDVQPGHLGRWDATNLTPL